MEIISLKDVKNSDGWKYLSENNPKFEELAIKFITEAKALVNPNAFNPTGIFNSNEGEAINYETYYYGSKKVVFSYNSKPTNRDLDCQFKMFKKIEFSLNKEGNLEINELSGRIESKYGYTFDNSKDGILKTSYSYQEFNPQGIELVYRGYDDKFILDEDKFVTINSNLRGCICGGLNPKLDEYDGTSVKIRGYDPNEEPQKDRFNGFYGKNPTFVERFRNTDNLGLVRVVTSSFNKYGNPSNRDEEYCFNTFIGFKGNVDPFLIHINRGIAPIARIQNGKLIVNYRNLGVRPNNFKQVAKTRFGTEIKDRKKTLVEEIGYIPENDREQLKSANALLKKYIYLWNETELDKWIWKDIPEGKESTRK